MKHPKMTELILRCMHARTNAHLLHLGTQSFAQHLALEAFYEGVIEHADELCEVYQGQYGLIAWPDKQNFTLNREPVSLVRGLADWIGENRKDTHEPQDTHLSNIIDEIVALSRRTQYKLVNLK